MIDEFRYQMLLDISGDLGVTRQTIHNWKKLNRVPLPHALLADIVSLGELNAFDLSGGHPYTHSQLQLMLSTVESIVNGEVCKSTAHILNYLQVAQPPLYEKTTELLSTTEVGKTYLDFRMMHTGESGESRQNS